MPDDQQAPMRRGQFGPVGDDDLPLCDECGIQMHPFAKGHLEGYGCDDCGWSFDASLTAPTVFPEFKKVTQ